MIRAWFPPIRFANACGAQGRVGSPLLIAGGAILKPRPASGCAISTGDEICSEFFKRRYLDSGVEQLLKTLRIFNRL